MHEIHEHTVYILSTTRDSHYDVDHPGCGSSCTIFKAGFSWKGLNKKKEINISDCKILELSSLNQY